MFVKCNSQKFDKLHFELTAAFWVSFFLEAGIPQEIAAEYAVRFITDGIQEKILPDLTKKYLRSMAVFDLRDIQPSLHILRQTFVLVRGHPFRQRVFSRLVLFVFIFCFFNL